MLRRCGHVMFHQTHHCQQDTVLQLLAQRGTMNQKQIQEQLAIKPGSASELISKLEDKGMLLREKDPRDHRHVLLTLTEKGQYAARIFAERPDDDLFAVLNEDEKKLLLNLLEKLHSSWEG